MPVRPSAPEDPVGTRTATEEDREEQPDATAEAVPEREETPAVSPPATAPAAARAHLPRTVATPSDRQVPVLTLGAGLTMVGLGIGFLGVRLRRR
ncbi:hypothetical protein GCM10014713_11990 [Streptomyces purpureus]|uniref:Uncharacterized protein n=1 Tax=Streptomyces purpureus TaxID=1951 RepID=A0A918GZQ3_9ACTN|nr:hypothetical protein GCM10014713_11990 [Streptomyces purpureus]